MDEFIQEPTLFDEVLKYGLYAGAVFQLACIAAVIFSPSDADQKVGELHCLIMALLVHGSMETQISHTLVLADWNSSWPVQDQLSIIVAPVSVSSGYEEPQA